MSYSRIMNSKTKRSWQPHGWLLCSDFDAVFASFELDLDPTSRRSSLYVSPSPRLMHGRVAYIEENLALCGRPTGRLRGRAPQAAKRFSSKLCGAL